MNNAAQIVLIYIYIFNNFTYKYDDMIIKYLIDAFCLTNNKNQQIYYKIK